jgi:hypothetical protein
MELWKGLFYCNNLQDLPPCHPHPSFPGNEGYYVTLHATNRKHLPGVWMSDKVLTQQRLTAELASLIEVVPAETVVPFLDAFWTTMAREWVGIDVLRY